MKCSPLIERIKKSFRTEEDRGYSNVELAVTLTNLCFGNGIDINYHDNVASLAKKGLNNTGECIPDIDFTILKEKTLHIFPEARFGLYSPKADFALYYKNGFYELKLVIEVQTKEHQLPYVFENDCHKMQFLYLKKWPTIWVSSKQVFNDKEGKFLLPFLVKILSESKKFDHSEYIPTGEY